VCANGAHGDIDPDVLVLADTFKSPAKVIIKTNMAQTNPEISKIYSKRLWVLLGPVGLRFTEKSGQPEALGDLIGGEIS